MVAPQRVRLLTSAKEISGTIIYWMSRDQRVLDNWAMIFAQELAEQNRTSFAVVFCLREDFPFATERLLDFMLKGLEEVEEKLTEKNIPFYFLLGDPEIEIEKFIKNQKVGALVTDFFPLKIYRKWKNTLLKKLSIPFYEVDAHNIIPVWETSNHQEFAAYTIRPKIHKKLSEFLVEFETLRVQKQIQFKIHKIEWKELVSKIKYDKTVKKVNWTAPGEKAAHAMLDDFIENRLEKYAQHRNDPSKHMQSNLSPYLHFGHISAQRIALEIERVKGLAASKNAFLEELIVRRELSDNFCYYNKSYDSIDGFPDWARESLEKHKNDPREVVYSLKDFENARTHDPLWNAAQMEMIKRGKMHGYMRMYWAKKIFEWSSDVEQALKNAIYLNDLYFLDGRDPNGYTGIAWSIGGVHDRAWFERPIFGKIRYMNYNGAKSKFDIDSYISWCNKL